MIKNIDGGNIDGGATEADGGASAPVGPSVATPLMSGDTHLVGSMGIIVSVPQLYGVETKSISVEFGDWICSAMMFCFKWDRKNN